MIQYSGALGRRDELAAGDNPRQTICVMRFGCIRESLIRWSASDDDGDLIAMTTSHVQLSA
jgi:hypothetical protein